MVQEAYHLFHIIQNNIILFVCKWKNKGIYHFSFVDSSKLFSTFPTINILTLLAKTISLAPLHPEIESQLQDN